MCFHWVASFGFNGVDAKEENRFIKKKKKSWAKKMRRRGVLYRFAEAWVVWEDEWKELK